MVTEEKQRKRAEERARARKEKRGEPQGLDILRAYQEESGDGEGVAPEIAGQHPEARMETKPVKKEKRQKAAKKEKPGILVIEPGKAEDEVVVGRGEKGNPGSTDEETSRRVKKGPEVKKTKVSKAEKKAEIRPQEVNMERLKDEIKRVKEGEFAPLISADLEKFLKNQGITKEKIDGMQLSEVWDMADNLINGKKETESAEEKPAVTEEEQASTTDTEAKRVESGLTNEEYKQALEEAADAEGRAISESEAGAIPAPEQVPEKAPNPKENKGDYEAWKEHFGPMAGVQEEIEKEIKAQREKAEQAFQKPPEETREQFVETESEILAIRKSNEIRRALEIQRTAKGEKLSEADAYTFVRDAYLKELGYYLKFSFFGDSAKVINKETKKPVLVNGKEIKFNASWKSPEGETDLLKFLKAEFKNRAIVEAESRWKDKTGESQNEESVRQKIEQLGREKIQEMEGEIKRMLEDEKTKVPAGKFSAEDEYAALKNWLLTKLGYDLEYQGITRGEAIIKDRDGKIITEQGKPILFKAQWNPKGETPIISFLKTELVAMKVKAELEKTEDQ